MYYHNPKDDPYDPNWRKTLVITDVIINVETTGITIHDANKMRLALEKKEMFALHDGKGSVVTIDPKSFSIKQGGTMSIYTNIKQLINIIKLILFTHNKVYTVSKKMIGVKQKLLPPC